jgi:hypothetical protein
MSINKSFRTFFLPSSSSSLLDPTPVVTPYLVSIIHTIVELGNLMTVL